jgi:phosphoglycerate dehydrogenase-like enzyme
MALTVYIGSSFPPDAEAALERGLEGRIAVRPPRPIESNLVAQDDDNVIDAEVVFGQPAIAALAASPRVRWVHLTSAGYTRYASDAARAALTGAGVTLTTSSAVYAEPCATHALALVLALLRELPAAFDDQRGRRAWPAAQLRSRSRVLAGARVLLLGLGAIGRRLATLLAPWGAEVVALREHPRGDEPVRTVAVAALEEELAQADVVISSLPESPSTIGFLDRARIERMKPGALFVNVGRGTTVDQDALADALGAGKLGGAGLDVTDPEPLPADHRLWTQPRCIVTPHTAGGQIDEHVRLVRHFLENLGRYERGQPLVDRVL